MEDGGEGKDLRLILKAGLPDFEHLIIVQGPQNYRFHDKIMVLLLQKYLTIIIHFESHSRQ